MGAPHAKTPWMGRIAARHSAPRKASAKLVLISSPTCKVPAAQTRLTHGARIWALRPLQVQHQSRRQLQSRRRIRRPSQLRGRLRSQHRGPHQRPRRHQHQRLLTTSTRHVKAMKSKEASRELMVWHVSPSAALGVAPQTCQQVSQPLPLAHCQMLRGTSIVSSSVNMTRNAMLLVAQLVFSSSRLWASASTPRTVQSRSVLLWTCPWLSDVTGGVRVCRACCSTVNHCDGRPESIRLFNFCFMNKNIDCASF